jgi:transcriptional regulator with XRE-family HTH domain
MLYSELRALRHELRLTQSQLAEKLGTTRGTISRWELKSGTYPVSTMAANLVRLLASHQRKGR